MMTVENNTRVSAGLFPDWNREAKQQYTLVLKQGFYFSHDGALLPLLKNPEIHLLNKFVCDPCEGGLLQVHDVAPFKHGAEFILFDQDNVFHSFAAPRKVKINPYRYLCPFKSPAPVDLYNQTLKPMRLATSFVEKQRCDFQGISFVVPTFNYCVHLRFGINKQILLPMCDTAIIYLTRREIHFVSRVAVVLSHFSKAQAWLVVESA